MEREVYEQALLRSEASLRWTKGALEKALNHLDIAQRELAICHGQWRSAGLEYEAALETDKLLRASSENPDNYNAIG